MRAVASLNSAECKFARGQLIVGGVENGIPEVATYTQILLPTDQCDVIRGLKILFADFERTIVTRTKVEGTDYEVRKTRKSVGVQERLDAELRRVIGVVGFGVVLRIGRKPGAKFVDRVGADHQ